MLYLARFHKQQVVVFFCADCIMVIRIFFITGWESQLNIEIPEKTAH